MKHLTILTTLIFSALASAGEPIPGGLPEQLDCRLSTVTPRGKGAAFRRSISLVYQAFDPSRPRRTQSEFKLLPNGIGIDYVGETAKGVELNMAYKKGIVAKTDKGYTLTVEETRGGGTGYGTPSFTVTSLYKCQ